VTNRTIPYLIAVTGLVFSLAGAVHADTYGKADVISPEVFVTDSNGSNVSLLSLLAAQPDRLSVVYIFGGGDMGTGMPGNLWCQDSFEDTHILRTLAGKYGDSLNIVAVASAPVYHSQTLGAPARVFLDQAEDSAEYLQARTDFITSTQASFTSGILPVQPYFDLRFRLSLNPAEKLAPGAGFGELASWMGAFRNPEETQFYGVPSFWLVSPEGEILAEPLRGNIYHPHGAEVNINYTFADVDAAIQAVLNLNHQD